MRPELRRGETIACRKCGKSFYVPRGRVGKAVYCSKACMVEGKPAPCQQCGKETHRPPSQLGKKKYCSMACRDAAVRARRVKDGMARCARCRAWKPVDEFVKGRFGRPHSHCKPCNSEWFKDRRGVPAEKRRAYRPAYRLTPEEKAEKKRQSNHMQHQARRAAGPKPHRFDIMSMLCLQDARCAYCRTMLNPKPGDMRNKSGYHIDHKLPVSRGGTNDLDNLQLLCPRCNISKNDMTDEEFLASKRRKVTNWEGA